MAELGLWVLNHYYGYVALILVLLILILLPRMRRGEQPCEQADGV